MVLVLFISQTYVFIVCKVYPFSFSFFFFLKFNMESNICTLEFTATVRGFHVFQKKWKPALKEQLHCLQEPGDDYVFSIKNRKPDKTTVGHLPKETSRPTKFFLGRGAKNGNSC